MGPVVLITGCSSGIGRALAEALHRRKYRVVATARRPESLEPLRAQGLHTERLDVTRPEDHEAILRTLSRAYGRLDWLINNAGYGLMGPVLELAPEDLWHQFQTNTLAPVQLTRTLLPLLEAGQGRVVQIGSVSGELVTPFAGAYCASKAALHALSEALRMELMPWGLEVILVKPGAIRSRFGQHALEQAQRILKPDSRYAPLAPFIQARATASQQRAMPAERFAERLIRRLERRRPPAVIRIGPGSRLLYLLSLLPPAFRHRLLARRFGLQPPG